MRVIREVLFFEPQRRGTDLNGALEFLLRVTPHRAIAVIVSDFIGSPASAGKRTRRLRPQMMLLESLAQASFTMLRQANRRHDVVAVQIADRFELELPDLGRLVFTDAETGEVVEVNTGDARKRHAFSLATSGISKMRAANDSISAEIGRDTRMPRLPSDIMSDWRSARSMAPPSTRPRTSGALG